MSDRTKNRLIEEKIRKQYEWDVVQKVTVELEEKERAFRKHLRDFMFDKMNNEPYMMFKDMATEGTYKELADYVSKKNENKWKYLFITVNFKEMDLEDPNNIGNILKKTMKITAKKWVNKAMYCYETRGLMKGLHVHMKIWVDPKKKIYDCQREVYNTVKELVGNQRHVDRRYSNIDGCFEEYIRGIKGKVRKANYENDKLFRKRYGLDDVYIIEK